MGGVSVDFKVNLNQEVKVKLTEYGTLILKEQHDELNEWIKLRGGNALGEFELRLDEDGYYSTQIWMLMSKFGHAMRMGSKNPFNLEVIIKNGEPL